MLVSTIVPRCLRVIKTVHDLLPARIIAVLHTGAATKVLHFTIANGYWVNISYHK